ncbi:hypothetical protein H4R22_000294 [Coemansia sp. RSA 1290]|nr:hypothetical protein H4R22_000294 [Coemansia sp. RSA 1290]
MDIEDFRDTLSELKVILVWPSLEALDENIREKQFNCEVHIYNNEDDIKPKLEVLFNEALELYDTEELSGDEFVELINKMDSTQEFGTATVQELQTVVCQEDGNFITEYDQRFKSNKLYRYYKSSKQ